MFGKYLVHGILKLEVVGLFLSLIILASFVQIQVPFLAFSPPELPQAQIWYEWQFLQVGMFATTFQVVAILACILVLDAVLASLALGIYLALGLMGLPIFYGGGGLAYLQEGTFGYLVSFLGAAWICGFILRRHPRKRIPRGSYFIAGFVSLVFIHVTGGIFASIHYQMVPVEFLLRFALPQLAWQTAVLFALSGVIHLGERYFHPAYLPQVQPQKLRQPGPLRNIQAPVDHWRKSA